MSSIYGPPKPEEDMIQLIHHSINSGVTFLDTSEAYEIRGDPGYVRAACESSLKRLDMDCIDLYYQHRIDTRVPIEITMGELKKLVEEGKIKYIGLSEASPSTIRRAHAVHPITAIQLEWSLWTRDVEEEIVPTCRELGIGIVAYSPLGRGFLSSGPKVVENLANEDSRKALKGRMRDKVELASKFGGHFADKKTEIRGDPGYVRAACEASLKRLDMDCIDLYFQHRIDTRVPIEITGCTLGQLVLAWVHHQGSDVCPIPGTTKIANLDQNIGALSVKQHRKKCLSLNPLHQLMKLREIGS
ncbi:hypothetical protein ACSBR1_012812 [Camellia fascicularis]